ncbi:unnamed protein product, partial [Rotaria sordida]
IKTYLKDWPGRCLLVWCTVIFLIASWCLRACEYQPTHEHWPLTDAMWLFVPIFGTVGYSNLAPSTYCGRTICALSGVFGVFSMSFFIAIATGKLILTPWENYVHTFVLNTELAKEHKHQAANVIKFAWKTWFWKAKKTPLSSMRYLQMERKLHRSIGIIHEIKQKQRCLNGSTIGLPEIQIIERSTSMNTEETIRKMATLESKMDEMEGQLVNLDYGLNGTQNVL